MSATPLEAVLRRDRLMVGACLVAVVAMAWAWLLAGAGMGAAGMEAMNGMAGMVMRPSAWTPAYALLMLAMWWVMMVAMMLPGAAPMLLLFGRMNRQRAGTPPLASTGAFAAGYLLVWGGFSVAATALQWALERSGLLSPMLQATSSWLAAGVLVAAGAWQLSPLKAVCLRHCRSPLGFLVGRWRSGPMGALRMGLEHGGYCLGCCWFLMGLLFVGGVMNLYWIAGLAVYVLLEKVVPLGHWLGRLAGIGLVGCGLYFAARAVIT